MNPLPPAHAAFLARALPALQADPRVVGVAAGGSFVGGTMDRFSDLDLVVAVEPEAFGAVLAERPAIAAGLGPLVAAFTGEHVGEPRLLIGLYDGPPLHVDLKFVALPDAAARVEDPAVLWERDGRLTRALATDEARYPMPDPQWIEARFWVWVHYAALKVGRGELFEAVDFLAFLRGQVLGPLILLEAEVPPSGVRRVERAAPARARELEATVAAYSAPACVRSLYAAIALYRSLRASLGAERFAPNAEAERVATAYLDGIAREVERSRLVVPDPMVSKEADPMGWTAVTQELDDAVEHLQALLRDMAGEADFGGVEFRIGLGHVYAHLNRAWHQRTTTDEEQARFTQAQFEAWSRWPTDLDPIG